MNGITAADIAAAAEAAAEAEAEGYGRASATPDRPSSIASVSSCTSTQSLCDRRPASSLLCKTSPSNPERHCRVGGWDYMFTETRHGGPASDYEIKEVSDAEDDVEAETTPGADFGPVGNGLEADNGVLYSHLGGVPGYAPQTVQVPVPGLVLGEVPTEQVPATELAALRTTGLERYGFTKTPVKKPILSPFAPSRKLNLLLQPSQPTARERRPINQTSDELGHGSRSDSDSDNPRFVCPLPRVSKRTTPESFHEDSPALKKAKSDYIRKNMRKWNEENFVIERRERQALAKSQAAQIAELRATNEAVDTNTAALSPSYSYVSSVIEQEEESEQEKESEEEEESEEDEESEEEEGSVVSATKLRSWVADGFKSTGKGFKIGQFTDTAELPATNGAVDTNAAALSLNKPYISTTLSPSYSYVSSVVDQEARVLSPVAPSSSDITDLNSKCSYKPSSGRDSSISLESVSNESENGAPKPPATHPYQVPTGTYGYDGRFFGNGIEQQLFAAGPINYLTRNQVTWGARNHANYTFTHYNHHAVPATAHRTEAGITQAAMEHCEAMTDLASAIVLTHGDYRKRRELHMECTFARLEGAGVGHWRYHQGHLTLEEYIRVGACVCWEDCVCSKLCTRYGDLVCPCGKWLELNEQ